MTTGVLIDPPESVGFSVPGLSPSAPAGMAFYAVPALFDPVNSGGQTIAGTATDVRPTDPIGHGSFTGRVLTSYTDDFYNQIYVIPNHLDFGSVTQTVAQTVAIWNAYLKFNANLTGVDVVDAGGTYLSSGSPVEEFKPLQYIDYAISADIDGPPIIKATYTFHFSVNSVLANYSVTVDGNRAKLLPFLPNWSEPYKISYEYLTEIITSRSGREQRIAQRITPRKSFEYKVTVKGAAARRFNQLLSSWQHRVFVLPELTRKIETTAAVSAGTTSIVIPKAVDWVRPRQVIVIGDNHELNEIVSVTPTGVGTTQTVIVSSVIGYDYPGGVTIWSAVSGFLNSSQSASLYTSTATEATVKFNVKPASEDVLDPGAAPTIFNGREVFTKAPNWSSPLDLTFDRNVEELDYARGVTTRFNPVAFGTQTRRSTFLARSVADADAVVKFNDRMRGRQGEFYMSSGLPDILIKSVSNIGTTALRVAGLDLMYAYADDTTCKAVCVRTVAGQTFYNKVLSIDPVFDDDGSDTLITCLTPWTVTLNPDTVLMISWMPAWCLGSDTLTIEWVTDTVAQFQMSMRTIEDLPV